MRRDMQQRGDHALRPMVGCRINTYIPDRITEGYGLNEAGLRAIKDVANTLVITCEREASAIPFLQIWGQAARPEGVDDSAATKT